MEKKIFKEPTRYSNLFSKVLSINPATREMLNQRCSVNVPVNGITPKIKLVPNECTQK